MKVNFCIQLLCLLQGGLLAAGKLIPGEVSSLQQLDYDGASRLTQQWILYTAACESRIRGSPVLMESPLINVAQMGPEVVVLFRADHSSEGCVAARLVKGMTPVTAATPLHGDSIQGIEGIEEWISNMLRVEMGWVSYWKGDCTVFWIDHDGNRVPVSRLKPRESNTFWTQSFLGHIFEIADASSGELVGRYVAEYDSFNVVGDHVLAPLDYADPTAQIERELHSVYHETSAVKRTFSELGFQHGKLPADVWGSISSYYYNNREHKTFEEQVGASVFINWWEANCYFIGMPWGLKGRWQARLLTLVQDWIGGDTPLEQTDIYGIRRYERGARLLSHVDRITTHAVSLIINVAQEDMKEPWMVEIYDFAGRLHEIEMQPGDIVYYEVVVDCSSSLNVTYVCNIYRVRDACTVA